MTKTEMIFVVGNARSGTTMMARVLGKNQEVFTFPELHFFEQLWTPAESEKQLSESESIDLYAQLIKILRDGFLVKKNYNVYYEEASLQITKLFEVDKVEVTKLTLFKFFLQTEVKRKNKRVACEQTPRNLLYINEILKVYPESKFINMVRDPRDILLSQKNKWKRKFLGAKQIPFVESIRSWINYHPITISKIWSSNVKSVIPFTNHPRVHSVKFEDFINSPEKELKRICTFLQLPYDKSMLNVAHIGSSTGRDNKEAIGINKNKTGQWNKGNLNLTEVFYCQQICKNEMSRFNYSQESVVANPIYQGYYFLSFPLKLSFSFLMNVGRMKNPVEAIKRRLK